MNANKIIPILGMLVMALAYSCVQSPFLSSKAAYLGQTPPDESPKIFAPGMLADSGIVLGKVQFSQNGKAFYYSYARHWFDNRGSGSKEIKFDGARWQKPRVIAEQLTNPAFSPDEKTMYLGAGGGAVWTLNRTATGWSGPVLWMQSSNFGLYNFQATRSGTYYIGSNGRQGSKQDWSTYNFCSLNIKGKDTLVQSLGTAINTPAFDGDFYIAPDESYMIVSAKETKDYESELWISFRKKDQTWTAPQSLGGQINTGLAHRFGQYVSPDGKYLFYTKGTSEADCNIYWVRIDKTIAQLRKSAGL
ncbi:MAG TPA: hypothetical protein PLC89_24425 [Haliscomenobacter sp.]|uniref:hypothetical protein n=1 Tax=Haliscomenobacter sp. TaxID=2717303 RepID=UPI002CD7E1A8|nr:hypothetical protein [Haliscomenobacter sp.]HOY20481.1 hypothetical protein [Haliscomenobacter sp.]